MLQGAGGFARQGAEDLGEMASRGSGQKARGGGHPEIADPSQDQQGGATGLPGVCKQEGRSAYLWTC